MLFDADSLHGRITVFTGFGKGSGKTTFFCAATLEARKTGPVGLFTIGLEANPGKPPATHVEPGDVVITTVPLLRASDASLDIIEALPGRSALGRLCVCCARRAGPVGLVGPEHFSQLESAIEVIQQKNLVKTLLVDGAAGRITQAGTLRDAQFIYCAQIDPANFSRATENMELLSKLADLPLDGLDKTESAKDRAKNKFHVEGPLTDSVLEAIPKEISRLSIGTFSDCFLDAALFNRASQRFCITVRRRVPLLGFAVALKNIKREKLLAALPFAASLLITNPFEPFEHGAA